MASILELMKRNAVPAAVMRTASKGALPIPPEEMLEVLVYLTNNPVFAQDARMTLASYDLSAASRVVASGVTAPEVLGYYWTPENRRLALMPALIENPAIPETLVMELAAEAPRPIVTMLLASERVRNSQAIIAALETNPRVFAEDLRVLQGEDGVLQPSKPELAPEPEPVSATELGMPVDPEAEAIRQAFEQEHAAEIRAEEGKGFQLINAEAERVPAVTEATLVEPQELERAQVSEGTDVEAAASAVPDLSPTAAPAPQEEVKKLTLLQKLGKMTASERVKAAFTGSREERAVLIRDGAKVVQNAVLASPKLTEPEVEVFAAAKNVHENVLREIARSRRFMKNYSVMRNLVLNPKTPLDISMPLVKMLMVFDLKALQRSRNISETIRKLATKYYREKAMSGGKTND
jgi:hypothetical protein